MSKKYEVRYDLTRVIIRRNNVKTLHRIRALRDIPMHNVKAGDLGGWVEDDKNLNQIGDCWIADEAIVCSSAYVSGGTLVSEEALVEDGAIITDKVMVTDSTHILGNIFITGSVKITGHAIISNAPRIFTFGNQSTIAALGEIGGNFESIVPIHIGNPVLKPMVEVNLYNTHQFVTLGPMGSRDDYTTFYLDAKNRIRVSCGCFEGTIYEFALKVEETYPNLSKETYPNLSKETFFGDQYRRAILFAKSTLSDFSKIERIFGHE